MSDLESEDCWAPPHPLSPDFPIYLHTTDPEMGEKKIIIHCYMLTNCPHLDNLLVSKLLLSILRIDFLLLVLSSVLAQTNVMIYFYTGENPLFLVLAVFLFKDRQIFHLLLCCINIFFLRLFLLSIHF